MSKHWSQVPRILHYSLVKVREIVEEDGCMDSRKLTLLWSEFRFQVYDMAVDDVHTTFVSLDGDTRQNA